MNPIPYKLNWIAIEDLSLGYHGSHTDFVWRPYKERSEEAREDYDKLKESILKHRVKKPLITFKGHVLIGMRRAEIVANNFDIKEKLLCAEILEDVYLWDRNDIPRLNELKATIGEFSY